MQITQGLHRAVQINPDGIATICEDRVQTFSQLKDRVGRGACGFLAQGLKKNQVVAMMGANTDYYLEFYLICGWSGLIANPINFRWNTKEVIYSLNDSRSSAVVFDDKFAHLAEEIGSSCPEVEYMFYAGSEPEKYPNLISVNELIESHPPISDANIGGDAPYGVFYTGGTSGFPKGVMLSHRSICSSALELLAGGGFPPNCRGLHTAPMFHLADMMLTVSVLMRGGSHVMLPSFRPEDALALIEKHQATDTVMVPTMLKMLIEHPNFGDYNVESLARVYYGGAPFSDEALDASLCALPNVRFWQTYGMTETSGVMTVLPFSQHEEEKRITGRVRSSGQQGLNVQIKIVDESYSPLPAGSIGQIVSRSAGLMLGYLNKPKETAATLQDGWLLTGDMGYMNEEGSLFVVGRLKEMIITGGENVYGVEVEDVINRHPAIDGCAVFGVPDRDWGETVHVSVVFADGKEISLEELVSHCKAFVAGYKSPRSMNVIDALPLSGAGKVEKKKLRDSYLETKR